MTELFPKTLSSPHQVGKQVCVSLTKPQPLSVLCVGSSSHSLLSCPWVPLSYCNPYTIPTHLMGEMAAIKQRVYFAGSNLAFKQYAKVCLPGTILPFGFFPPCYHAECYRVVITVWTWWRQNEKRSELHAAILRNFALSLCEGKHMCLEWDECSRLWSGNRPAGCPFSERGVQLLSLNSTTFQAKRKTHLGKRRGPHYSLYLLCYENTFCTLTCGDNGQ